MKLTDEEKKKIDQLKRGLENAMQKSPQHAKNPIVLDFLWCLELLSRIKEDDK